MAEDGLVATSEVDRVTQHKQREAREDSSEQLLAASSSALELKLKSGRRPIVCRLAFGQHHVVRGCQHSDIMTAKHTSTQGLGQMTRGTRRAKDFARQGQRHHALSPPPPPPLRKVPSCLHPKKTLTNKGGPLCFFFSKVPLSTAASFPSIGQEMKEEEMASAHTAQASGQARRRGSKA